jgi:DEAD/DEAH box helicase domain-containing protein
LNDLGIRLDPADAGEPWVSGRDTDVLSLLSRIKRRYADRITGELIVPGSEGRYTAFPCDLDPRIARAVRIRGIERL